MTVSGETRLWMRVSVLCVEVFGCQAWRDKNRTSKTCRFSAQMQHDQHAQMCHQFYSIPQGTAVCVCGLRPISQRPISFLWFNLIFIYLIIYFFVETVIGCSEYQEVREPTSHASSLSYISHHPNISSASSINRTDSVFSHFLYLFLILSLCLYLAPSLSFPPFFFLSVYDHFSSNCSPVRKPSYPFIYFFHVLSHF